MNKSNTAEYLASSLEQLGSRRAVAYELCSALCKWRVFGGWQQGAVRYCDVLLGCLTWESYGDNPKLPVSRQLILWAWAKNLEQVELTVTAEDLGRTNAAYKALCTFFNFPLPSDREMIEGCWKYERWLKERRDCQGPLAQFNFLGRFDNEPVDVLMEYCDQYIFGR
jgi:hypothetical protein